MKRSRPKQHKRRLRSGRSIIVNKGVKKKKKNFGFIMKSINWKEAAKASKERQEEEIFIPGQFRGGQAEPLVRKTGLTPVDMLKFTDLDKAFTELDNKGLPVHKAQQDKIKELALDSRWELAFMNMPRPAQMTLNLGSGFPESIERERRLKKPKKILGKAKFNIPRLQEDKDKERRRNKLIREGDSHFLLWKETGDSIHKRQAEELYRQASNL